MSQMSEVVKMLQPSAVKIHRRANVSLAVGGVRDEVDTTMARQHIHSLAPTALVLQANLLSEDVGIPLRPAKARQHSLHYTIPAECDLTGNVTRIWGFVKLHDMVYQPKGEVVAEDVPAADVLPDVSSADANAPLAAPAATPRLRAVRSVKRPAAKRRSPAAAPVADAVSGSGG